MYRVLRLTVNTCYIRDIKCHLWPHQDSALHWSIFIVVPNSRRRNECITGQIRFWCELQADYTQNKSSKTATEGNTEGSQRTEDGVYKVCMQLQCLAPGGVVSLPTSKRIQWRMSTHTQERHTNRRHVIKGCSRETKKVAFNVFNHKPPWLSSWGDDHRINVKHHGDCENNI